MPRSVPLALAIYSTCSPVAHHHSVVLDLTVSWTLLQVEEGKESAYTPHHPDALVEPAAKKSKIDDLRTVISDHQCAAGPRRPGSVYY
jgi:hypothetical protein